jgi:diphthamide biosynthesis protein 4
MAGHGFITPSHYEILSLDNGLQNVLTPKILKAAYRRALLRYHPDKKGAEGNDRDGESGVPTIDMITEAYEVLRDGKRRVEYDRFLRLQTCSIGSRTIYGGSKGGSQEDWKTGIEVVDLDDLQIEEGNDGEGEVWYRGCRCGDQRGYVVEEKDLVDAEGEGERQVLVGCMGCSLWLMVQFGIVEEEELVQNGYGKGSGG